MNNLFALIEIEAGVKWLFPAIKYLMGFVYFFYSDVYSTRGY